MNAEELAIYDRLIGSESVLSQSTKEQMEEYRDSIGMFGVLLYKMRNALRNLTNDEERIRKFSEWGNIMKDVSSMDGILKANNIPAEFIALYKSILSEQNNAIKGLSYYTANACYNNEHSGIVYAPNLPVKNSMSQCFRDCSALMGLDENINFSQASSMDYCFYGSSLLPCDIILDIPNCTSLAFMGGNFKNIKLVNANKVINYSQFQYQNINISRIEGLNLNRVTSIGAFINTTCEVLFEGIIYGEDGSITRDETVENYWLYQDILGSTTATWPYVMRTEDLYALCLLAYDWKTNPKRHALGSHRLSGYFSVAQKSALNAAYGENNIRQIMEDKGWIY